MKKRSILSLLLLSVLALSLFLSSCGGEEESSETSVSVDHNDAMASLLCCRDRVEQASHFRTETFGKQTASFLVLAYEQNIYSERVRDSGSSFLSYRLQSDLSSSELQLYRTENAFLSREGNALFSSEPDYEDPPVSYTSEAFCSAFGAFEAGFTPYLLTEETIKTASLLPAGGNYTYVFDLDPVLSTENYRKLWKACNGTDTEPTFTSVRMTVEMDAHFYPRSVHYEEEFTFSFPLFGTVAGKADYTESFTDFGSEIKIPDEAAFTPHLSDEKQKTAPVLSGGFAGMKALFGHSASYDLSFKTADYKADGFLTFAPSMQTLWLQTADANLILQKDTVYFDAGETKISFPASELPNTLHVLQLLAAHEEIPLSDLAAAFSQSGEDTYSAEFDRYAFTLTTDPEDNSVNHFEAQRTPDGSGNEFSLSLTRLSDFPADLPTPTGYTPLENGLKPLSFFVIPENTFAKYTLHTEGILNTDGELCISTANGLQYALTTDLFSVSFEDGIYDNGVGSIRLLSGELIGTKNDWFRFRNLFTSRPDGTEKPRLSLANLLVTSDANGLTLSQNGNTLCITGETLTYTAKNLVITLTRSGETDSLPVIERTENGIDIACLADFFENSPYPALWKAGSVTADLHFEHDGKIENGTMLLTPASPFALGITLSPADAPHGIVVNEDAFYYSGTSVRGFVDTGNLGAFLALLASRGGEDTEPVLTFTAAEIELLTFTLGDLRGEFKNDHILLTAPDFVLSVSGFAPSDEHPTIMTPAKETSVDLYELLLDLDALQTEDGLTFTGTAVSPDFRANVNRFDISLKENTLAFELSDTSGAVRQLYVTPEGYFLNENGKRFYCNTASVRFLFPDGLQPLSDLSEETVKELTLKDGLLTLATDDFSLQVRFEDHKPTSAVCTKDGVTFNLLRAYLPPLALPEKSAYQDVSALGTLFASLKKAKDAGNLALNGQCSLGSGKTALSLVSFSGKLSFEEQAKGFLTLTVPYLPGVTSNGIAASDSLRAIQSCTIRSTLYLQGNNLYFKKTITAVYGLVFSKTVTTESGGYMTLDECKKNPMKALAFLLNLENGILDQTESASVFTVLDGITISGNSYGFRLNPALVSPSAKTLTVTLTAGNLYPEKASVNIALPAVSLSVNVNLSDYGRSDPSSSMPKDYSGYPHL